jgi:hypothetical protein
MGKIAIDKRSLCKMLRGINGQKSSWATSRVMVELKAKFLRLAVSSERESRSTLMMDAEQLSYTVILSSVITHLFV